MKTTTQSRCVLALDQGSQSSRAIVYSASGHAVAKTQIPVSSKRHGTACVEQSPDELLASLFAAIAGVAGQIDPELIVVAGLATQRSSIVCWNRVSGRALSPVLSWQDRRAEAWLEAFSGSAQRVQEITGLLLSPHYGVSKMRWCLDNNKAVQTCAANGELVMGPLSSYLTYQLLDEHPLLVDPANASRTLLLDYQTGRWSEELVGLFGIPQSVLPEPVTSCYSYGMLNTSGVSVPLQIVTGDQSAALFAFGEARSNTVYANLGTGAFLQRPLGPEPVSAPGLLNSVVYSDNERTDYVLEGTVNGAGSAVNYMAHELQLAPKWVETHLAQSLDEVAEPPLFLNGVSGLGAPWWIADFRSHFLCASEDSASPSQDAAEKMTAVIESIVFMLQTNFELCVAAAGMPERWLLSGGLSALDGLCQRLADISGVPVMRPDVDEATACGVSYLLGVGSSLPAPDADESVFVPQTNPNLEHRYLRWRYAMAECITAECN
jgi:glycerol kinase